MDEVKKWAVTVSAVSIISGVVASLLPDDSYKNLFRFIAGIILVYAVLQPLIGKNSIEFDINEYIKENYEVSEDIDKYAQNAMLDSAEKAIENLLSDFAEKNNTDLKINCKCEVQEGNIVINEIRVADCVPEENLGIIKQFAIESGFDESVFIWVIE